MKLYKMLQNFKIYTGCSPLKTTRIKALEWYLFIVINKKIGGERKMTWDEILEWIKEMIRI